MNLIFQIIAILLAGLAGYFYWSGNSDGMFVSVVLACVAFFFNVRIQVKRRNDERDAARKALMDEDARL